MEEAAYIDSVRLVAYDVPPGWSMVLDERKAISPPEATGDPRFYRDELLPIQAVDDEGKDVTRAVTAADGVAAPPGRIDPRFIGRTDDHLADTAVRSPTRLALEARRCSSPTAGSSIRTPRRYLRRGRLARRTARRRSKHAAATADGACCGGSSDILPACRDGCPCRSAGSRPEPASFVSRTTQEIYWDRLAVAYAEPRDGATPRVLPLMSARLAAEGFPRRETARVAASFVRLRSPRPAVGYAAPERPLHRDRAGRRTAALHRRRARDLRPR